MYSWCDEVEKDDSDDSCDDYADDTQDRAFRENRD